MSLEGIVMKHHLKDWYNSPVIQSEIRNDIILRNIQLAKDCSNKKNLYKNRSIVVSDEDMTNE